MRKTLMLVVAALGLVIGGGATAYAQDIVGLSLRATDAMPGVASRGLVDIVKSTGEGNYVVKVDLLAAAEALDLTKFEGANAWVVWAVDMDGVRHNLGTLNEEFKLPEAAVDYLVARVYVTAEGDAKATAPGGEPLFSVTLRNVDEVDSPPADAAKSAAQAGGTGTTAPTAKAEATTAATIAAPAAASGDQSKDGAKPKNLPTTGDPVQDVLMVLVVAAVLLFGGWRLRSVRL